MWDGQSSPMVLIRLQQVNFTEIQGSLARSDLWYEAALLQRLLYKNNSQHRRAHYFRKLLEVKRLLALLQSLQLATIVDNLRPSTVAFAPASRRDLGSKLEHRQKVPSRQAGLLALHRLQAACCVVQAAGPALHGAAALLSAQISQSFFLPFSLTALAMLARIKVLCCQVALDAARAYNSLLEVVVALPVDKDAPLESGDGLPQMLKWEWAGALPRLQPIPFASPDSFEAQARAFEAENPAPQNNAEAPWGARQAEGGAALREELGTRVARPSEAADPAGPAAWDAGASWSAAGRDWQDAAGPGEGMEALQVWEDRRPMQMGHLKQQRGQKRPRPGDEETSLPGRPPRPAVRPVPAAGSMPAASQAGKPPFICPTTASGSAAAAAAAAAVAPFISASKGPNSAAGIEQRLSAGGNAALASGVTAEAGPTALQGPARLLQPAGAAARPGSLAVGFAPSQRPAGLSQQMPPPRPPAFVSLGCARPAERPAQTARGAPASAGITFPTPAQPRGTGEEGSNAEPLPNAALNKGSAAGSGMPLSAEQAPAVPAAVPPTKPLPAAPAASRPAAGSAQREESGGRPLPAGAQPVPRKVLDDGRRRQRKKAGRGPAGASLAEAAPQQRSWQEWLEQDPAVPAAASGQAGRGAEPTGKHRLSTGQRPLFGAATMQQPASAAVPNIESIQVQQSDNAAEGGNPPLAVAPIKSEKKSLNDIFEMLLGNN